MKPNFIESAEKRNESRNAKIAALVAEKEAEISYATAAELVFESIEKALAQKHLVVETAVCRDRNIAITAKSDGKFKFIAFAGYTSRGAGKNQERLNTKSEAIEECVRFMTGFRCSVNCYSLEVKNAGETKNVLVDVFLPTSNN